MPFESVAPSAPRESVLARRPASDFAATALATWFGCGKVPLAPGTVGAAAAIPIHLGLRLLPAPVHALTILGLTGVGVWAAGRHAARVGVEDPQEVVIDEVVGALIAMGLVRRRGLLTQLFAWGLFRAYDIVKPGLVGRAEHLRPAGVGIMADDVVAGVMAGLSARASVP